MEPKDAFRNVEAKWDLERLYADLEVCGYQRSETRDAHLRGVLSGRSPKQIAGDLNVSPGHISTSLTEYLAEPIKLLLAERGTQLDRVDWKTLWFKLEQVGYVYKTSEESGFRSTPEGRVEVAPPSLERPEGIVPLGSPFYMERPYVDADCYREIEKPGALIVIRGAQQMGKSSLMERILARSKQLNYHRVLLRLQQADRDRFTSLDVFLRWFCANIDRQLGKSSELDKFWDKNLGYKVSCTGYFQAQVLEQIDRPLVLGIEDLEQLFEYQSLAEDFLSMLRMWHEESKNLEVWKGLRLIGVHSTKIYFKLDTDRSPFNVGLQIDLPEIGAEQIALLAQRHGLNWASRELEQLMQMLGGHPYLVRLAMYDVASRGLTLNELLEKSSTNEGIYRSHLRQHLTILQRHAELAEAMKAIVDAEQPKRIDEPTAYKLEGMGLIKPQQGGFVPSRELYRLYFQNQLRKE